MNAKLRKLFVLVPMGALLAHPAFAEDKTWWVDAANYGKADLDGSEARPFGTIQSAIDNPECGNGDTILVRPGCYSNDFTTVSDSKVRVVINKKVHLKASGSKEETLIVGYRSTKEEGGDGYGNGPNSVRCIAVTDAAKDATITGFTICNGGTADASSLSTTFKFCGGGVAMTTTSGNAFVTDCVISNCACARFGAAVYYGTYIRCRIVDNRAKTNGAAAYRGHAINCLFARNAIVNGNYDSLDTTGSGHYVNCSFVGNPRIGIKGSCYNCLFTKNTKPTPEVAETLMTNCVTKADGAEQLVDPDAEDYRLLQTSAAIGRGETRYLAGDCPFALPAGIEIRDLSGRLIDLTAERVHAGAFQEIVRSVIVSGESVLTIDGGAAFGENRLGTGSSISISLKPDVKRHCLGALAGGETNFFVNGSCTVTVGDLQAPTADPLHVEPCIDPNWYVGSSGNDDNDGWTPQTAKLTLAGVLSVATNAGDIVHAAAGTYASGSMTYSAAYGSARAVVADGVTLTAESSVEDTVIRGEIAGGGTWKDGPGSLRCVMLGAGSTVRGFTLTEGAPDIKSPSSGTSTSAKGYNGGGVWSDSHYLTARVVDCVISNCHAFSGAGAFYVALFNTKITGCRSNISAVGYSSLYGCFVNDNQTKNSAVHACYDVFDCTVGPKTRKVGTTEEMPAVSSTSNLRLRNSLVLGDCSGIETWTTPPCNCAFVDGKVSSASLSEATATIITNAEAFAVDAEFRPLPRASVLCEAGDDALLPDNVENAALLQTLRAARPIMNGGLDIGALEADWRDCYTEDLGGGRFSVAAVSPNVAESESRTVRIVPGASLEANLVGREGSGKPYLLRFRVSGSGVLSVTADDVVRTFTSADGDAQWESPCKHDRTLVKFAYEGADGYAELLPGRSMVGIVLIVR